MYVAIIKYADLKRTWKSRLKEVEDCMTDCDRQLKEAAEWESKLEELVDFHNSCDARETTIWELEARMTEKDGALIWEWAHVAKMEAQLNPTIDLLCLVNKKVKVAEGEAASIVVRMVVEYKESDDFVNDATKGGADAYIVGFIDCRKKVAQPSWHLI